MGIADDPKLQSTVTAIYDVGCFLGALSTIWIGEKFGRKNTIGMYDKTSYKKIKVLVWRFLHANATPVWLTPILDFFLGSHNWNKLWKSNL